MGDQLAALSSLETPGMSGQSAADALKDLQGFDDSPSSSQAAALSDLAQYTSSPSQSPQTTPKDIPPGDDLDFSSLTLPDNYENFLLPTKGKKSRVRGLGRRSKKTYATLDIDAFNKNNPSSSQASEAAHKGAAKNLVSNEPVGLDSFGLSTLDGLSAALQLNSESISSPKTPSRASHASNAYDDFFKGLNSAQGMSEATREISPRGHRLIRAYGARDDMNKRGMQKIKKKTVFNARGRGVYQMEDAHVIVCPFDDHPDRALFCVFDGHVDKNAAIEATKLFPAELSKNILTQSSGEELGDNCADLLIKTFLSTDDRMKAYDMEGCTATSVLFWRENNVRYVQSANVGDSTAFLCRDGKAMLLSKDHKVNEASERQRLLDAGLDLKEGATRINGLAVSRALGDHFIKDNFKGVTAEPYVSEPVVIDDEKDSLMILASDGLWDTMSGQDAVDAIKRSKDPQSMASTLVNMALSSGLCKDNITVIVVMIN